MTLIEKVRKLAREKEEGMTSERLLKSDAFMSFAKAFAAALAPDGTELRLIHDAADPMVGVTCGGCMTVNTGSRFVSSLASMYSQVMAVIGVISHECAHNLFLDAEGEAEKLQALQEGRLPVTEGDGLEELASALADPKVQPVLCTAFRILSNIIADAHDERRIIGKVGGIVEEAIGISSENLRIQTKSLEQMRNERKPLEVMWSLILQFARFGEIIVNDDESYGSEEGRKLVGLAPHISRAVETDGTEEKYREMAFIISGLLPYIEDEMQEGVSTGPDDGTGSPGDPGSECGQGNAGTGEKAAEIMQALAEAASGMSTAAPSISREGRPEATPNDPGSEGNARQLLRRLVSAAALDEAENETERNMEKKLRDRIDSIAKPSIHEGITTDVRRHLMTDEADRMTYESIYGQVRTYSRNLQRQMKRILDDFIDDDMESFKTCGRIIEARNSYRPDRKFFADMKAPGDTPDMAVAVLIDQSGSMCGERIDAAMKAAVLLEDFTRGLGIPTLISGHQTGNDRSSISYHVYCDFERAGIKDRYRIAQCSAGNCNRDGLALLYTAALLARRPEKMKLLMILSDGNPNDSDYYGEPAFEDIRCVVKAARKSGMQVIAAAIGEDKQQIEEIYGDGFLDITDLSRLPKLMANTVRRKLC